MYKSPSVILLPQYERLNLNPSDLADILHQFQCLASRLQQSNLKEEDFDLITIFKKLEEFFGEYEFFKSEKCAISTDRAL